MKLPLAALASLLVACGGAPFSENVYIVEPDAGNLGDVGPDAATDPPAEASVVADSGPDAAGANTGFFDAGPLDSSQIPDGNGGRDVDVVDAACNLDDPPDGWAVTPQIAPCVGAFGGVFWCGPCWEQAVRYMQQGPALYAMCCPSDGGLNLIAPHGHT